MGTVAFSGQGPFTLPAAQSVSAIAMGDTVEVGIRLLVDPSRPELVIAPMAAEQALTLGHALFAAADRAMQRKREQGR